MSIARNTKVFLSRIFVMKVKSFYTTIISAPLALATFIFNGQNANLFTAFCDSTDYVLSSIAIFSLINFYQ